MAEDRGLLPIETELEGERAAALGEAGRRLERALDALAVRSAEEELDEAATAAWYFVIVRESLRMFDHKEALKIYGVPPQVMSRIGVVKRVK
ncbi:MAG: hypothetical protein JWO36_1141 [Myxococcales bacterium]|nr:hypothetical protein [Myxococcales bacterium]